MTASDDHKFGGEHTQLKLSVLRKYLPAYTTALKKFNYRLHYIDGFAGTGTCRISTPFGTSVIPGSAQIAIDCNPPFHRLHFIEQRVRRARTLQLLADRRPDLDIEVIKGDANTELPRVLARLDARDDRAVTFLDPYGMSVSWTTLEAMTRHVTDVWYLFPLSALYRQTATSAASLDADKSAAIDRLLGTHAWYDAFYAPPRHDDLFGDVAAFDTREANVTGIVDFVSTRLRSIFNGVAQPKVLYQTNAHGKRGAPLFVLYFAITNPSPKAVGLALGIANDILKRD